MVAVCVAHDATWSRVCAAAKANARAYVAAHGYGLRFFESSAGVEPQRKPHWAKLPAIASALRRPGVEAVLWKDSDSLFMDLEAGLGGLVPHAPHLATMTGDANCWLNDGHFLLAAGSWSEALLARTYALYPSPWPFEDQSAMVHLLTGERDECRANVMPCCAWAKFAAAAEAVGALARGVQLRPQRELNSYLPQTPNMSGPAFNASVDGLYRPGDLVLHFAGLRGDEMATLMEQYAEAAPRGVGAVAALHASVMRLVEPEVVAWASRRAP